MEEASTRDPEEDVTMDLSQKKLTFRFQKEILYNKLLPYAEEINNECLSLLSEIKGNLGQAVVLRELEPGCLFWTYRLYRYIRIYGFKFSKEDHILFIKLIYELLLTPNLTSPLIYKFGYVLTLLLKKKECINPNELELPWRPLYELITTMKKRNSNVSGMYRYSRNAENMLCSVAHLAKVYFPLSATQEILNELTPSIYPLDPVFMARTIDMLDLFLPLRIPPEHHEFGHELWLNDLMTLWEQCRNAPQWEHVMMSLMAKLADCNIGYINWEPFLPLMFTRFMRSLNLPVSYKQMSCAKLHRMDITPISMWIVAVLGNSSSSQRYLNKFLKTIETYLHPANSGSWSNKLRELLAKLPFYFLLRLEKERYRKPTWETPVPEEYKLTDDDIDAFVKSILPLAMTAMFNKTGAMDICHALQYLAILRPNLVLPDVLEQMYATLDTVTKPHKLTAAMVSMISVALPMVQGSRNTQEGYTYPEGPTQVLPFLFSLLPGIDPNDTGKCFITLRVITLYAVYIPIVDSSRSSGAMDENERMICEETSRFEDFILQFLDRIFQLIESSSLEFVRLESRVGDGKSELESLAESVLDEVCTQLLMQTSDTIFESALHKLRTFVTERILETNVAGQLVAMLCKVFASVNGGATLRALVPLLSQTVLDIIGEGEDVVKEENADNRLLYALLLLSSVVETQGHNLLPYTTTLQMVLDRVLFLKSREGSNIAYRMLASVLSSLTTVAPYKFQHIDRDYNDPEYPFVRDWGKPVTVDSMKIHWYVPGDVEHAAGVHFFSRYLLPQVEKLKGFCEDWNSLTRHELMSSLNIVRSIIWGCDNMLPLWEEPPLSRFGSPIKETPFMPTTGIKHKIVMPDGSNVRQCLVELMIQVQKTILKYAEDDTKSLFVLIKIWSAIMFGKEKQFKQHDTKWFQEMKKIFRHRLNKSKARMVPILVYHRVIIQHEMRLQMQTLVFTKTHYKVLLELFTLGTSRYPEVRLNAQIKLSHGLKHFSDADTFLMPHIIDVLKRDTEEHHDAYKGVLYILLQPQSDPIIARLDWHMIRALWPAIVLSKPSEKHSITILKDTLVKTIHRHFLVAPISMKIPQTCLKIAVDMWKSYPLPTILTPNKDLIVKGLGRVRQARKVNLEAYIGILDDLSEIIEDKHLHWRHRLMAMSFICDLANPEQQYTPKVLRHFLHALVHDSSMERGYAIQVVVFALQQQKRKHPKVTVDVSTLSKVESSNDDSCNIGPGRQQCNSWLQYDYETRPLTAEQWDEPRFIHQPYVGYYRWPKKLHVYAPSADQPILDPEYRQLSLHEKEVELFFTDTQNVEKLIRFLSLEGRKGLDKFNVHRFNLFKCLFRNHGIVLLKNFTPHLWNLVQSTQESDQRCAAEITAGIIQGAKHWPFRMTCDMWSELTPIIRTALSNLTVEMINDWALCFATAQRHRDPNRQHWLLECLMEEVNLGSTGASFAECGRLYVLESVLNQQLWRVPQLLERLLICLEDRLFTNPFQNVRERLGSVLSTIFDANTLVSQPQYLIDKILPRLKKFAEDIAMSTSNDEQCSPERVNFIESGVALINLETSEKEREANIRLFKTVCTWISRTSSYSQFGTKFPFYEFFPIICQLESYEMDKELAKKCSVTLSTLARAQISQDALPMVLEVVTMTSRHASWLARVTCLEFLQVFIFHNMSTLLSTESWVDCVKTIVLSLLEDTRLEVRETACRVLGGLLHCTFITDQDNLLEYFKRKAKTELRKRNHVINDTDETERNAQVDAVRLRHAGVLGLCAFIRAHPYNIPKFVPLIFEHLSRHLNDPQPIPTTIRKTLDDFKRTHYDRWTGMYGHAEQFTSEQLSVLQDLAVPPSYYA